MENDRVPREEGLIKKVQETVSDMTDPDSHPVIAAGAYVGLSLAVPHVAPTATRVAFEEEEGLVGIAGFFGFLLAFGIYGSIGECLPSEYQNFSYLPLVIPNGVSLVYEIGRKASRFLKEHKDE